jgi:hypothetical protein
MARFIITVFFLLVLAAWTFRDSSNGTTTAHRSRSATRTANMRRRKLPPAQKPSPPTKYRYFDPNTNCVRAGDYFATARLSHRAKPAPANAR